MSRFVDGLRRGDVVTLVNADHPSASVVAALGPLGVEAVMIDCEQGVSSLLDVEHLARAARLAGVAAVVRVPTARPWVLERYLHRDVDGVVIPRLDRADEAAAAVATIRYHWPAPSTKAIVVQVESAAAVEDLDGFLAIPDVDCFFLGPVDLAKSLGVPDVAATVETVVRRITGAGRRAGTLVTEADARRWREVGVTMLYTHVDHFLALGARRFLGKG